MVSPFGHDIFDNLNLWLTPFEVDPVLNSRAMPLTRLQDDGKVVANKYNINFGPNMPWSTYCLSTTTFKTRTFPDGGKIEPPSPQLLALQAACAQIAQMSGAVGPLREAFRESILETESPSTAQKLFLALRKAKFPRPTRT